jgi:branched-chain amino acid aminotransferase
MGHLINCNGELVDALTPVIRSDDRSFRFGDGLFETMRVMDGSIRLQQLHFDRLFNGLQQLAFDIPPAWNPSFFKQQILALANDNDVAQTARVRLTISRGEGSIKENTTKPLYIVETFPLEKDYQYNAEGITLALYTDARKVCDKFSNIKSNNYLPYIMAVKHAARFKVDDCIILNSYDRVCETSISNLFLVKENSVYTVPLTEGPVNGVMRRFLVEQLSCIGYKVIEEPIEIGDLDDADEIFVTNAISGIRWVSRYEDRVYSNQHSFNIYSKLLDQDFIDL